MTSKKNYEEKQVTIYKLRYLDTLDQEVMTFGYFECRTDAMRKWQEVQEKIKMPGKMSIQEIEVIPDSTKPEKQKPKKRMDYESFHYR